MKGNFHHKIQTGTNQPIADSGLRRVKKKRNGRIHELGNMKVSMKENGRLGFTHFHVSYFMRHNIPESNNNTIRYLSLQIS